MMKNKELFVLVIVFVVIFGFMIPLINKSEDKRARQPALVQDFISVSTDTAPAGDAPADPGNVTLSESGYGKLMDFINYKGRTWDTAERKDDLFGGRKYFRVDVCDHQSFYFEAQPADDGSLDLYFEDRSVEGKPLFVTRLKAEIANALFQLMEGK